MAMDRQKRALLLGVLLPSRELQRANAETYRIPFVQVFKLFQYKFYKLVAILFRNLRWNGTSVVGDSC